MKEMSDFTQLRSYKITRHAQKLCERSHDITLPYLWTFLYASQRKVHIFYWAWLPWSRHFVGRLEKNMEKQICYSIF